MADFITTLASRAGIDTGSAQNGLGAILSTLQQYVPQQTFSRVAEAIPNAGMILETFRSTTGALSSSAGSAIAGMASSFMGAKSEVITTMMTQLSKAGLSLEMIRRFLPAAASTLHDVIPSDVLRQVEQSIPGITTILQGGVTEGLLGRIL